MKKILQNANIEGEGEELMETLEEAYKHIDDLLMAQDKLDEVLQEQEGSKETAGVTCDAIVLFCIISAFAKTQRYVMFLLWFEQLHR